MVCSWNQDAQDEARRKQKALKRKEEKKRQVDDRETAEVQKMAPKDVLAEKTVS
jgi:hypothetical protein